MVRTGCEWDFVQMKSLNTKNPRSRFPKYEVTADPKENEMKIKINDFTGSQDKR